MSKPPMRCRMFGHKWRAYSLSMPVFRYYCTRCGATKSRRMPWEIVEQVWRNEP